MTTPPESRWLPRPFDPAIEVRDVGSNAKWPREGKKGDEVVLWAVGLSEEDRDVYVEIEEIDTAGAMKGHVSRSHRASLRGDASFSKGAPVHFTERDIIRFTGAEKV